MILIFFVVSQIPVLMSFTIAIIYIIAFWFQKMWIPVNALKFFVNYSATTRNEDFWKYIVLLLLFFFNFFGATF